jgi:hypothetical protein
LNLHFSPSGFLKLGIGGLAKKGKFFSGGCELGNLKSLNQLK